MRFALWNDCVTAAVMPLVNACSHTDCGAEMVVVRFMDGNYSIPRVFHGYLELFTSITLLS